MKSLFLPLFLLFAVNLLPSSNLSASPSCSWQGSTVNQGEWLECKYCAWQYCQCKPDGSWGSCTNTPPSQGACDWSQPDWSNPSCSEGGSKPCDWSNPDWQNPSCAKTPPPSGGSACVSCHSNGVPQGVPPPHVHTWLPH